MIGNFEKVYFDAVDPIEASHGPHGVGARTWFRRDVGDADHFHCDKAAKG